KRRVVLKSAASFQTAAVTVFLFLVALQPAIGGTGAAPQTYVYVVKHPRYGNIGSYTETIDKEPDTTRLSSELRVAVKILGIVVHREETSATAIWRNARLAFVRSVTKINSVRTDVSGAIDRNVFKVQSASGTETAPNGVKPSDPWALTGVGPGVV